jgi:hypothetical protein
VSGTPLIIADSVADLTDGTLDAANRYNEFGVISPASAPVWTGLTTTATASGADCAGWSVGTSASTGSRGLASATNSTWMNSISDSCGLSRRLYCFEQ